VAKVSIKKSDLERQLRAATEGERGNPKIREKLIKAQSDFIDGLAHDSNPTPPSAYSSTHAGESYQPSH
jgi:hypothetical protein